MERTNDIRLGKSLPFFGRAGSARQFNPPVNEELDRLNAIGSENTKYRVRGDHRENPRRGVYGEMVPLTEVQETGDGGDVAAGDHHPRYRRGPQSLPRVQYLCGLDLQSQIRRRVEHKPVKPVSGYRQRSLATSFRTCFAKSCTTTRWRVRIPLWESPTGGGSENNRFKHRMSRRTRRRQEITRALDLGAGVSVDLEPDRDLDDDRRLPLHSKFPPAEFRAKVRLR